jgi:SAM-dependent methyltransferase
VSELGVSDDYDPDNFLDNRTPLGWRRHFNAHLVEREASLLARHEVFQPEPGRRLRVLCVGCGADARAGIPHGDFHVVGVDSSPEALRAAEKAGTADELHLASAVELPLDDASFDIVFFRFVLHHLIDQVPLGRVFAEARRVLRPGGRMVAVEPNLYHPIGLLLYCANLVGWSKRIKGTSDDWPLSPLALRREIGSHGFQVGIFGVEFAWRRLPIGVQRLLAGLERVEAVRGVKYACHTLMVVATKSGTAARATGP